MEYMIANKTKIVYGLSSRKFQKGLFNKEYIFEQNIV